MGSAFFCGIAGLWFGLWQMDLAAGFFMAAALFIFPVTMEAVLRQLKK